MRPMARKNCFFNHLLKNEPLRAFDHIWPVLLKKNDLSFEDETLEKAVACVRLFLEPEDPVEWFHVLVRIPAFLSFRRALDEDEGKTRTLPFSCWCDGGEEKEARFRQHRHWIVVSRTPGRFETDFLPRVKVENDDEISAGYKFIRHEPIASVMRLVDLMGSLSKQETRCIFSGEDKYLPEKQNHFYIMESLPEEYKLPLVLQWKGGLQELLDSNFESLNPVELGRVKLSFYEGKWRLQIKDIPGIKLNVVLPVSRDFEPSPYRTSTFLHLMGDKKFYFRHSFDTKKLTREAWLKKQADMGNLFYDAVKNEYWILRSDHEKLINHFRTLVDCNDRLKIENSELVRQLMTIRRALEMEASHWRKKYEIVESDVKNLWEKNSKLNDKLQESNDREIERLTREKKILEEKLKE